MKEKQLEELIELYAKLLEINNKIIANLESQVATCKEIIGIKDATIKKLEALINETNMREMSQDNERR